MSPQAPLAEGTITVRVVDKNHAPFPGLSVQITSETLRVTPSQAPTDTEGRATFRGLVPGGTYVVSVTTEVDGGVEVVVDAGMESDPIHEMRLLDLRAGVPVTGRATTTGEEEICEAVFNDMIEKLSRESHDPRPWYYLSIMGRDPAPGFMKRLGRPKARLEPGSRSQGGSGDRRPGIYYILPMPDGRVEVGAGHYGGFLDASGHTFVLIRREGRWIVESDSLDWISQLHGTGVTPARDRSGTRGESLSC